MFARILLLLAPVASLGCGINNNCGPLNPFGCAKDSGANMFGEEGSSADIPTTSGSTGSTSTSTPDETSTPETSMDTTTPIDPTTSGESTSSTVGSTTTIESTSTDPSTSSESTSPPDDTSTGDPCGDGDLDPGEECDDGNRDDSDGCSNSCVASHHVVFVTQTKWKGDLDGLEAADGKCNAAAGDAGLDGSYRAWLSTEGNVNAKARIGEGFTGVYELVDGTKVADGWAGLTSPPLDHEINVDEFGNVVMSGSVWTNTTTSGESAKGDLTGHCEGWDTTGNNLGLNMPYTGDLSAKDARWTKGDNAQSCNFERRLYCFQVGP